MKLWKTWLKLWIKVNAGVDNFRISVDNYPVSVENPVDTCQGVTLHV
jgi:hypothetical protein